MTQKYKQFIFKNFNFDKGKKLLELEYSFDNELDLKESYHFDFEFKDYNETALDLAMQNLFLMAGVSYYKMYVPGEIVVNGAKIDQTVSGFLSKTYEKGLGEFWYVNQLDPNTKITFPATGDISPQTKDERDGLLIAIGGGKDSLVTTELLRSPERDIATWSLNHQSQLSPLVEKIGLPHYFITRNIDPKVLDLNKKDALNGHIPISAIFACVGTVLSILTGKRDVVVSNEQSASEFSLVWQGVEINHQYSKSFEFEKDYQAVLDHCFAGSTRYYSFLRPLSELRVAELFAKLGFEKYREVFSSCNRAYTFDSERLYWCGKCAKCAFTYLALSPFIPEKELNKLWGGKNLLAEDELEDTYRQLLGIKGEKPLDCVGEIKESRSAMNLAQKYRLDLLKYHYELPANYDYKTHGPSSMPKDMLRVLLTNT